VPVDGSVSVHTRPHRYHSFCILLPVCGLIKYAASLNMRPHCGACRSLLTSGRLPADMQTFIPEQVGRSWTIWTGHNLDLTGLDWTQSGQETVTAFACIAQARPKRACVSPASPFLLLPFPPALDSSSVDALQLPAPPGLPTSPPPAAQRPPPDVITADENDVMTAEQHLENQ